MRVYVAARYGRREEMLSIHAALRAAGHEPTSRWVEGAEEGQGKEANALMDVDDVLRAHVLLLFTDQEAHLSTGGGRFFEMGLAYGVGLRVVVVGPRQVIFCHLPQVEVYEDLDRVLRVLGP